MPPLPAKLSFRRVLSESYGFFFLNINYFFVVVAIPWIISLALSSICYLLSPSGPEAFIARAAIELGEIVADIIPIVMFTVAWIRLTLLGQHGVERLPGRDWTRRETTFLAYLVRISGIPFLLLVAIFFVSLWTAVFLAGAWLFATNQTWESVVDQMIKPVIVAELLLGIGFCISTVRALRVSFGLAAISLEMPITLRMCRTVSRGNGWKIVGILLVALLTAGIAKACAGFGLLAVANSIIGPASIAPGAIACTAATLVSYAGVAIVGTAQAIIFRTLTGWRSGPSAWPATEGPK